MKTVLCGIMEANLNRKVKKTDKASFYSKGLQNLKTE